MERINWKHKIANLLARNLKSVKGGYLGRQRFILTTWIYRILPYLGFDYCRLIEWRFILENLPKVRKLKILDVGSTASLFIYGLAKYGKTFGIDSRPYFEKLPKTIKFLQYDVLKMPFSDSCFDVITFISVVEHIGLSSYGGPLYDESDFKAMSELKRVLRPDGMLFMTTLVGNSCIITANSNERIYNETRLNALVKDYLIEKEAYYIFRRKWIPANKKIAFQESPRRFALACLQLKNK